MITETKQEFLIDARYEETMDNLHLNIAHNNNYSVTGISSHIATIPDDHAQRMRIWESMQYNQGGIYLPAIDLDISLDELSALANRRKLGRPLGSLKADPLDNLLRVRCKSIEKAIITKAAREKGLKLSEFVRQAALEKAGGNLK